MVSGWLLLSAQCLLLKAGSHQAGFPRIPGPTAHKKDQGQRWFREDEEESELASDGWQQRRKIFLKIQILESYTKRRGLTDKFSVFSKLEGRGAYDVSCLDSSLK